MKEYMKKERPQVLLGSTRKIRTGCGHMYVTICHDENEKPFECFCNLGKSGGCASSQTESLGRLISLCLRCNVAPERIIDELQSISCHTPFGLGKDKIWSCADAVAKALRMEVNGDIASAAPVGHVEQAEEVKECKPKTPCAENEIGCCPECGGSDLYREEGCLKCRSCFWSKCG